MTHFSLGQRGGKLLGLVLAGTVLASATFAQGFGGPPPDGGGRPGFGRPPGGGPPPVSVAHLPLSLLHSALKLSAAQDAKIKQIEQKLRPPQGGPPPDVGGPRPDGRGGGPGGFGGGPGVGGPGGPGGPRPDRQADTQIRAVLTADQKKALPALLSKMNALGAAGIPPPVYPELKLTASQTQQLIALGQSAQQAQKKARASGRPPGGFGPGQDPMRQTHEKAMALLTSAQRTMVEQFRQSHRGPGGPGGGGPGGFGGGPGGGGPGGGQGGPNGGRGGPGGGRRGGGGGRQGGGGFGPPPPGNWGPPPGDGGPPPPGMDGPG